LRYLDFDRKAGAIDFSRCVSDRLFRREARSYRNYTPLVEARQTLDSEVPPLTFTRRNRYHVCLVKGVNMARIEIASPAEYVYATDIPIRVGDINRGRHLAHDAVLAIMEEARVRFVRSLGYLDESIDGAGFIVVDAGIMYRKQGFYGQTLRVEIALSDFSRKGCDIIFRITNAENGDEMVRAKTGILFYNYREQKVAPVPESFRQRFAPHIGAA
jgi:4-hydroxybenzoyl-CoA thioesterase